MGYRSVMACPYIANYERAVALHNSIKPIRGKEVKPLGQRRDANSYSIRMTTEGDVECVLGNRNSAITFHPDNTVTLNLFWSGVECNQMFSRVLGVFGYVENRQNIVVINNIKHVYDGRIMLRIKEPNSYDSEDKYEVINPKRFGDWRLNIKKANAVRKSYAGFLTYVRSMVKLRQEKEHGANSEFVIKLSLNEVDEHFKRGETDRYNITKHEVKEYIYVVKGMFNAVEGMFSKLQLSKIIDLMLSDNTNDWHKVMCCFVVATARYGVRGENYVISAERLKNLCRDAIYEWHKLELFEWKELEIGKVPTKAYDKWMQGVDKLLI